MLARDTPHSTLVCVLEETGMRCVDASTDGPSDCPEPHWVPGTLSQVALLSGSFQQHYGDTTQQDLQPPWGARTACAKKSAVHSLDYLIPETGARPQGPLLKISAVQTRTPRFLAS